MRRTVSVEVVQMGVDDGAQELVVGREWRDARPMVGEPVPDVPAQPEVRRVDRTAHRDELVERRTDGTTRALAAELERRHEWGGRP